MVKEKQIYKPKIILIPINDRIFFPLREPYLSTFYIIQYGLELFFLKYLIYFMTFVKNLISKIIETLLFIRT